MADTFMEAVRELLLAVDNVGIDVPYGDPRWERFRQAAQDVRDRKPKGKMSALSVYSAAELTEELRKREGNMTH